MTAIIILNWNGADDTIECLDSLYKAQGDFFVVLADNGSADDSVTRFEVWAENNSIRHHTIERGTTLGQQPAGRELVMVRMNENLGFARGNNAALECLAGVMPEYVLLLNNDTIVEPDFLVRLVGFIAEHPQYSALTPQIRYNAERNMIWNCGGWQHFGLRKYYYANRSATDIREKGHIKTTFVTGCALFVRSALLDNHCHLLTERFFFGEEDFEFCLRMNKAGRKMACVLDSVIYHKVSASSAGYDKLGKIYVHYLNRYIDMRLHYSSWRFAIWRILYTPYVRRLLSKKGFTAADIDRFVGHLLHDSLHKEQVTHNDFVQAIQAE